MLSADGESDHITLAELLQLILHIIMGSIWRADANLMMNLTLKLFTTKEGRSMCKRFVFSMIVGIGLVVASIAPSWAIGFSDMVEKQAQGVGERFIGHLLDSAEEKASKEADNAINGSPESQKPQSQKPPKSQDNSEATPSKAPDTARSNPANPQGENGQGR